MNRKQLIKKYIEYFKSKDHKEIPNSSLLPENDPTVLFTTAGMHPLVPFLLGQKHPQGKRLCNVQRCIRTGDIEEVGDTTHHTFFEMTGNWSLGDYWKKQAIGFSFEFAIKILNLPKEKLAVTVFGGDKREPNIPKDKEAAKIWEELGIPTNKIIFLKGGVYESKENWWGPAGRTGPCGPCTEMFYWRPKNIPVPKKFDPENENWVEIWNDVLMEYHKDEKGNYNLAKQQNIDNGRGLERISATINNLEDNYLTDIWQPIIKEIEKLSGKTYKGNEKPMRIIADHIKAATMIIADGAVPGNTEQGYVVRRLIRRALRYLRTLEVDLLQIDATIILAKKVLTIYPDYEHLQNQKQTIFQELKSEEDKFQRTLDKGLREFQKMVDKDNKITSVEAFLLYQSYGFPIEMIEELAKEKKVPIDKKGFQKQLEKHQELSRTASAGKFKSGLADDSKATTRLHTSTHLLLAALRTVLKDENIIQRGSNITPERLRFDFSFSRKLEKEEIQKVEELVNAQIQSGCEVTREEMSPEQAKKQGATATFNAKYGEIVSVYTIKDCSKEICTGPHVKNTCELGRFKIKKEESSSSGVRRIKATLN
jgi:alanyl-tRNA synthetase